MVNQNVNRQVRRAMNIMVHGKEFLTVHFGSGALRTQGQNPLSP